MLFKHALVGQVADHIARRAGISQLAHHDVARRIAHRLGKHVGLNARLARHAPIAQLAPDGIGLGAVHLAQHRGIQLAVGHVVGKRFDRRFTVGRRHPGRVVMRHAELIHAHALAVECLLKVARIAPSVLVGHQVALGHQRLSHHVDGQAAFLAHNRPTKHAAADRLGLGVEPPLRLHLVAPQPTQLGDGLENVVGGRVELAARTLPARLGLGLLVLLALARQERPRAVDRPAHHLARHLAPDVAAQRIGLLLQFAQLGRPGVAQPLHVGQRA